MLQFKLTVSGGGTPCAWRKGAHDREVNEAAANHLRKLLKQHLEARGGRKYWKDAAESVETEISDAGAVVSINHRGVRLHFYGGIVKPTGRISNVTGKPIKRLLIPGANSPLRKARAELYELGINRQSVHIAGGALMADIGGVPVMLGVLARQSVHEPDPTVLPSDDRLRDELRAAARDVLDKLNL